MHVLTIRTLFDLADSILDTVCVLSVHFAVRRWSRAGDGLAIRLRLFVAFTCGCWPEMVNGDYENGIHFVSIFKVCFTTEAVNGNFASQTAHV